ncbi:ATP-binding cassette domain-containing protein [Tetragenococcus koreensis]|uniref:ABC transporter ATP-binding protein n=1 Tax=Tetragenococcus koreensis TaxID=290335 RepID=UPI000F4F7DC1|nr:ATP-binding cassette domain-containing protein [Tetragenococcus koreensis]AYW46708.1 ABC transporter ATP-binding protein [Tetragenococcus koreensis]MCF1586330.1 ATP-binding cassette domain-containing protein [Tetragenococcus koreensis]MCF1615888.1 ATP-binding cassette domain-containing protein [Tetragenococcus koreensis]MCF1618302.1 ATP-binding cassette domain-containing protein [Tetragenococcus koreensis]MCF1620658.1 ATP-binding cassette domain-containing protein [Tetragenococcus koreensis
MNIIETQDITKTYSDFTAVSKVNLQIPTGKVYGLLGPNGAGKSTLMKMFLGLTNPTSGSFVINDLHYPQDRNQILKSVGSLIEAPAFYGNLTGEENLEIIQQILDLPKSSIEKALNTVGITKWKNRQAKKYSLGMKQRLGLASALIGSPSILILDEPTNGLDPVGVHEIRTLIQSLPEKLNCTVIVSSHLLSEIELVADKIGILNHGQLLFEGTIEQLKANSGREKHNNGNLEETFLSLISTDNDRRGLSND